MTAAPNLLMGQAPIGDGLSSIGCDLHIQTLHQI